MQYIKNAMPLYEKIKPLRGYYYYWATSDLNGNATMYYEKKLSSGTGIMDFGKTEWVIVNKDDTAWPRGLI